MKACSDDGARLARHLPEFIKAFNLSERGPKLQESGGWVMQPGSEINMHDFTNI